VIPKSAKQVEPKTVGDIKKCLSKLPDSMLVLDFLKKPLVFQIAVNTTTKAAYLEVW